MKAKIEGFRYVKGIPQGRLSLGVGKLSPIPTGNASKALLHLKVIGAPVEIQHNIYWTLCQCAKGQTVDVRYVERICSKLVGEDVEVKRDGAGQYYVSPDSMEELILSKI